MIEDNTQNYLQLNSPIEQLADRVNHVYSDLRKFVSLFLYCRRPMPYDECNVAQCIINTDKYVHVGYCIENQYAGLLGIASVALPNRDLLFHLSDIEGHELNTMARDLYKGFSSAQNNLKKYSEHCHPKFQKSFGKMCQKYLNSYISYKYWKHIAVEDYNNLRFPPSILENILSFF